MIPLNVHVHCSSRLRSIKQLGTSVYVYPGAEHSRFQHSVGVMHLAGVFMDHLMLEVPGCADQKDKICVMIGGCQMF